MCHTRSVLSLQGVSVSQSKIENFAKHVCIFQNAASIQIAWAALVPQNNYGLLQKDFAYECL